MQLTPTLLILSIAASIDRLGDDADAFDVKHVLADHIAAVAEPEEHRDAIRAIFGGRLPAQYDPSLMAVFHVSWPDPGFDNPCEAAHRTYATVVASDPGAAVAMLGDPVKAHVTGSGLYSDQGARILPREESHISYLSDPAVRYFGEH